ncbi:polysaccharide deacetylase family protein [Halorarius litoreus]|uniref:polysaccharide deacetylase family protein n=1 Tax=Halorarius litoreus TaxID=2962676 RepID=UPI0020CCB277|nr:polysaccharide deacetylase family protein [Halorarius litoreus]
MSRQHDAPTRRQSPTADRPSGPTRRGFVTAVGAGAVALGGLTVSGSAAAQEATPRLVFTYDDGYVEDYTQTFAVHRQLDAPACAAVPSANVGRSEKFLSQSQLTEMAEAGWEVMSHGVAHEALGQVTLTERVSADDTKLYTDSTVLSRTPHEVEVFAGDTRATGTLTGDGEDGSYLQLESALGTSFESGASVRFTEDVVRDTLSKSKQSLSDRGFDVDSMVLPYGRYDERALSLIQEYYDSVANVQRGGLNSTAAIRPYRLSRAYFDEDRMSESELTSFMDRVVSRKSLGLLGGHSRNPALTGERIKLAIELAQERDIEIVTMRTALQEIGVVESTATPTSTSTSPATGTRTPTTTPTSSTDSDTSFVGGFVDWLFSLLN